MNYGYGSRRRRRENPIFFPNQTTDSEEVYGIEWGHTERNDYCQSTEIEEGEEEIVVDENDLEEDKIFIDGVQIKIDRIQSTSNKPKLVRYTTYLEEPILNVLKILKKNNKICVSTIVNESIKNYLKENYN